ncbi:peptidase S8, partial [Staphylococcus warneri]
DTGVYDAHEDLAGKIGPGYNTVSNNSDISDINGHGTSTLGTTTANGNNGVGVTSSAYDATPTMIKVSNRDDGAAYTSDIVT